MADQGGNQEIRYTIKTEADLRAVQALSKALFDQTVVLKNHASAGKAVTEAIDTLTQKLNQATAAAARFQQGGGGLASAPPNMNAPTGAGGSSPSSGGSSGGGGSGGGVGGIFGNQSNLRNIYYFTNVINPLATQFAHLINATERFGVVGGLSIGVVLAMVTAFRELSKTWELGYNNLERLQRKTDEISNESFKNNENAAEALAAQIRELNSETQKSTVNLEAEHQAYERQTAALHEQTAAAKSLRDVRLETRDLGLSELQEQGRLSQGNKTRLEEELRLRKALADIEDQHKENLAGIQARQDEYNHAQARLSGAEPGVTKSGLAASEVVVSTAQTNLATRRQAAGIDYSTGISAAQNERIRLQRMAQGVKNGDPRSIYEMIAEFGDPSQSKRAQFSNPSVAAGNLRNALTGIDAGVASLGNTLFSKNQNIEVDAMKLQSQQTQLELDRAAYNRDLGITHKGQKEQITGAFDLENTSYQGKLAAYGGQVDNSQKSQILAAQEAVRNGTADAYQIRLANNANTEETAANFGRRRGEDFGAQVTAVLDADRHIIITPATTADEARSIANDANNALANANGLLRNPNLPPQFRAALNGVVSHLTPIIARLTILEAVPTGDPRLKTRSGLPLKFNDPGISSLETSLTPITPQVGGGSANLKPDYANVLKMYQGGSDKADINQYINSRSGFNLDANSLNYLTAMGLYQDSLIAMLGRDKNLPKATAADYSKLYNGASSSVIDAFLNARNTSELEVGTSYSGIERGTFLSQFSKVTNAASGGGTPQQIAQWMAQIKALVTTSVNLHSGVNGDVTDLQEQVNEDKAALKRLQDKLNTLTQKTVANRNGQPNS